MDSALKKGMYYLGIVAAIYLFFYYVLPFIFKLLGLALKALFYLFIWAAVAFVVVMLVTHIVKVVRREV